MRISDWSSDVCSSDLDVVVLETAQDVDDRVDLADIAEELVAQSFALRRAAHQSRDIDEGELGRDDLLAARDRGELVEPVVGARDIADVRLDRAERSEGSRVGEECVSTWR